MMHYLEETVFDVLIINFNYVTEVSLVYELHFFYLPVA